MVSSRWVFGLFALLVVGCRTAEPERYSAEPATASLAPETASASRDGERATGPASRAGTIERPEVVEPTRPLLDLTPFRGQHAYAGHPLSPAAAEVTLLENIGFALGYCEARKDPLWVSYRLAGAATHEAGKRPSRFKVDERTRARVAHEDYKQADYQQDPHAYDRGHMAPNHAISTRYGREAQLETFYMTNICPQQKRLNQQTWEALEKTIADVWARELEEVWVSVGPIFGAEPRRLNGAATIPDAFYALVLDEDDARGPRVLALVLGQEVSGAQTLGSFTTTVDAVEAATGLDFYPDLPDVLEEALEAAAADDRWGTDRVLAPTHRGRE